MHYQGRAHALVVDDDRAHWLLVHRFGPWTAAEVLRLDQAAVTAAWAWEATFLDARIHGVLYNELTLDGRFRRTRLRLARGAIAQAGAQLAHEAAEMVDAGPRGLPDPGTGLPELPVPRALPGDAGRPRRARTRCAATTGPDRRRCLEEGRLGGATWGDGPRRHARLPALSASATRCAAAMAAWPRLIPRVVGRHHPVDEHLQAGGRQRLLHDLAQPHVLEHAAA